MAQLTNFTIPAKFQFRPYQVSWFYCSAEIVGWWEEPAKPVYKYPPLGGSLMKPIKLDSQTEKLLAREKVTVSVIIPTAVDSKHLAIAEMLFGIGPSYTVDIYRDEIPIEVLPAHENRHNTPDIGGRQLDVLACSLPEFANWFPRISPGDVYKNARAMRDEFFGLEADTFALKRFLNRWGLWDHGHGYKLAGVGEFLPFALVIPDRLWKLREKYRKALAGSAHAWMKCAPPLTFSQTEKPPFIVERSSCEDAIQATITIDHLAELKFGICKRHDCRNLFQRETAQKRLYCSTHCAHLANVRKLRAEKKSQSKGKRKANAKS